MFLELNKKPKDKVAAIDDSGRSITYGEICDFSQEFAEQLPHRSLIFILSENCIGSLLGYTAALCNRIVPLIISATTEEGLYSHLYELYQPEYLWMPQAKAEGKEVVFSAWDYCLVKTGNQPTPMYEELSLLLPTSGSTGSPKLVRHSYRNIEANADNVRRMFKLDGTEKAMAILPMHYTMGLSVIYCKGDDEKLVVLVTDARLQEVLPAFIEEKTHLFHQRIEVQVVDAILRNEAGQVINSSFGSIMIKILCGGTSSSGARRADLCVGF